MGQAGGYARWWTKLNVKVRVAYRSNSDDRHVTDRTERQQ